MKSLLNSLILTLLIGTAGTICYLATFSHVGEVGRRPALVAVAVTLLGCLPPLWFSHLLSNGVARQLGVIGWRLGIFLPSLAMFKWWEGAERNCFLACLLACYFVALPLESWLLIRELRSSN